MASVRRTRFCSVKRASREQGFKLPKRLSDERFVDSGIDIPNDQGFKDGQARLNHARKIRQELGRHWRAVCGTIKERLNIPVVASSSKPV